VLYLTNIHFPIWNCLHWTPHYIVSSLAC